MAENKAKAFDGAELTSFDILTLDDSVPNDESRELLLDPNRLTFISILRVSLPEDGLSTQDGLVFKGERVVIPEALQADITQRIHSTHIETEGCLRRARDCVCWHGMNDHIKKYVATCDICRSVDAKQQKETLKPHEPTTRPWTKVGTDLFNFEGRDYLTTVDYYSNFWEIDYLPDTKSSTVIRKQVSQ
ncbi:uncharacterized protein K02A2.6-like [Oreochromis niloticus]|uniref:uncharacterized protein K02A2.6-like n=1 Tax=Oreochromis niloticus TaxID=8128 RepID=UPI000DF238C7|nr:uncharacterized protein K02A2.6-like [Oreochromis niloticus]CAI5683097.1 unnamed protein product [Mustela putorius furo]